MKKIRSKFDSFPLLWKMDKQDRNYKMDKQDRNYKMDKQDRNYIAMATARWKRETDPVKRDRLQAIHEHCVGKKPGPLPYREDAIEALRAFRLPIRGMSDHARLNQSNQINEVIKRLNGT